MTTTPEEIPPKGELSILGTVEFKPFGWNYVIRCRSFSKKKANADDTVLLGLGQEFLRCCAKVNKDPLEALDKIVKQLGSMEI